MTARSGTATPMQKLEEAMPNGKIVPVVITYDPKGKTAKDIIAVSEEPFLVSKGNCEQVKWICVNKDHSQAAPKFTIDFRGKYGSPFYESQFSDEVPFSGLVRREVLPYEQKIYEYTIRIGKTLLDPGGGVKA